jgi:exosortase/archaeosortase family protein
LRELAFPVCFFLVAVPWPTGVETFITQSLMRLNTATTIELLGFFGIPAVQHANVIEVATGVVGINEACSGIRSLQATLMLSLFFGEVYALSTVRRGLCVLAGFALAFLFNVGRTLLLTWVASAKGVGAVASWHDPAGVTILVACFLSLWGMAWFQTAESGKQKVERGGERTGGGEQEAEERGRRTENGGQCVAPASSYLPSSIFHLRLLPWALLGWLVVVEVGTQLWYRSHEQGSATTSNCAVNLNVAAPAVTKVETAPEIRGQFRADQSLEGRWQDSAGNAWQLYYFRWLPAHSLQGRVAAQLAQTHGPEKCLPRAGMKLQAYLGIVTVPLAGMELAVQQYVFAAEGRTFHVFYGIYEDPTGSAALANRRRKTGDRIKAALAGSRNYGQRYLEVAVGGYERPEDAGAAFAREMQALIQIEK